MDGVGMRRQGRVLVGALAGALALLSTVAARPPAPASSPVSVLPILPVVTGNAALDHAERVALEVLAANEDGGAHRAAPFYINPWIRDSYAWGMVPDDRGTLGTYARGELAYWLPRQQPSGGWVTFQYSGWYDETPIYIAAVLDAYRLTGDTAMVRRELPALRRAWGWMRRSYVVPRQGSGCLLWASIRPSGAHWAADWADQVSRPGYNPQLQGLWYRATDALAALELLASDKRAARADATAATCIARDANRILWTVDSPAHLHAPALAPFGHYRAYPRGRNYFELDGNALLLAAGVAPRDRRASVLDMIADNARYLLGGDGAGPARVLYGDYATQDYGPIHNWMGPGRYQSAYWPNVGGLLAIAAARNDDSATALAVLRGIARRSGDAGSAFDEWYTADGAPGGAKVYGWSARMYLLALYRAYLGVDDPNDVSSIGHPADLVLRAAPGPARGELVRLGKRITIVGHGAGPFRYARLERRVLRSFVVPAGLLHDGAVLDVYRGR